MLGARKYEKEGDLMRAKCNFLKTKIKNSLCGKHDHKPPLHDETWWWQNHTVGLLVLIGYRLELIG